MHLTNKDCKANDSLASVAHAADAGAPGEENEITQEMIEAFYQKQSLKYAA